MSKVFYEKILSVLLGFLLVFIFTIASIELYLFYFLYNNLLYYYIYLAVISLATLIGLKTLFDFQRFKQNLELFLPNDAEKEEKLQYSNEELPEISLQVCKYYYNGASLDAIRENLQLKHAEQARRLLKQGLGILLKFYSEHKEREENE